MVVTLTEAAIIAGLVFAIVKMGIHLYGYAIHIRHIYPDAGGAIPYVRQGDKWIDIVPPHVRLVQVLSDSHIAGGKKPNATAIREVITASRAPMLEAEPYTALPAPADNGQFDISRVDPRTAPHILGIGETGSGKSTGFFWIFDQIRKKWGADFVVCEPGGVQWKDQADCIEYGDIADAIEGEYTIMRERQAILRASPVDHISDLSDPLPFRYLVLEEGESVLANLMQDRAKQILFFLTEIARMGRKTGSCLALLAQTAGADIVPTNVRNNFGNVFLFRGPQRTAENWRVSKLVNLPALHPGQAFDMKRESLIQFPHVTRPDLKNGGINGMKPVIPTPYRPNTAPVPHQNPLPTDPHTAISQAVVKRIYDIYRTAGKRKIKTTQRLIFPDQETGGHWWYWIDAIVRDVEGKPKRANSPIHLNIIEESSK